MNRNPSQIIDFSAFNSGPGYRRFLFLQGPHGDFFATLAKAITAEGHSAHRIHLNGGDKGDWMPGQGISYTGPASEWKQYLAEYLFRHSITDIVFYGYWRPYHRTAATLAEQLDIRLHVFEEGLLRPHWVTLDPRLPCQQSADIKAAMEGKSGIVMPYPKAPAETGTISQDPLSWMVRNCILHYLNFFRYRKLFHAFSTHRIIPSGVETRAWIKQFFTLPIRKQISKRRLKKALQSDAPFFLFCLQLDGDSQIRQYSTFDNMEEVMEIVLESFARHAPADMRLVVKNHPLDNGIEKLEQKCRRMAQEKGIASRVTFLNLGKLAGLLKKTEGLVTINSTAGLQALYHGIAVKTLGQAMYNIDGLADMQPLDSFWQAPQKPDAATHQKLNDLLAATSQHPGNFYDPACHADMIRSCLPLILAEDEKTAASIADETEDTAPIAANS